MKTSLLVSLLITMLIAQVANARTLEIDVHGMTCAFCVDSLEREFADMESISKVEISLRNKKIRLESTDTLPAIEVIRQTILDAGFTPVKIRELDNKKE